MMIPTVLVSLLSTVSFSLAADPSGGWLSFAKYTAPNPTDTITRMKASMIVPNTPENSGGSPAFWFGLQTDKGNGALVQPIMAKWFGRAFYMFQEIFDWTDYQDHQTHPIIVYAGEVITAEVQYEKQSNSYKMFMNSSGTTEQSIYEYKLIQKATESTAYFVLEHQPDNCKELPNPGIVSWTNIEIDVNNVPVKNPLFVPAEESPACGSNAIVQQNEWVNITWNAV